MYHMILQHFPQVSSIDHIVKENVGWRFIQACGLEQMKLNTVTENKLRGLPPTTPHKRFHTALTKELSHLSKEHCAAIKRKAIEEVFELIVLEKTNNQSNL